MQAQLFGLLDIAQDASTRTSRSVDGEKRRLLKALADKTARAGIWAVVILVATGACVYLRRELFPRRVQE